MRIQTAVLVAVFCTLVLFSGVTHAQPQTVTFSPVNLCLDGPDTITVTTDQTNLAPGNMAHIYASYQGPCQPQLFYFYVYPWPPSTPPHESWIFQDQGGTYNPPIDVGMPSYPQIDLCISTAPCVSSGEIGISNQWAGSLMDVATLTLGLSLPVGSYSGPTDLFTFVLYPLPQDNTPDLGPAGTSKSGCEGICGSPINLTNGNTYIQHQDYTLPGLGGGIQLTRTWNSLWVNNNPWEVSGMFSDSWQSNYEAHIQVTSNGAMYWRGDGSAWTFTYNSGSQTYSLTSPPDERATLSFSTSTNQFTLALSDGTTETFSQPGYLLAITDRNGNKTSLSYDTSNRLTSVTDAASRVLTFSYGNASFPSLVTSIQDTVGTIATYAYDSTGHLSSVSYPDASSLNFTYDANGLITTVADAQGRTIESHTYDVIRRGSSSQAANGVDALNVSYSGTVATLTDSAGHNSQYTAGTRIASRNYLTSVVGSGCDTCGGRRNYTFTYDTTSGNRTSSTDPSGHAINYSYDSNGNVTQKSIQMDSAPNYQTRSYTYNSFNEVLTATDPLGNVTTNTYDANGNLLTTTTPSPGGRVAGSKTSFTYDTKGELTKITDPLNHSTTIAYYPTGLVQTITDAQGKVTQFQYDGRGNRTAVIDANNQQTTFTYDLMNRLTKITYPTSPATYTQIGYDYRGHKSSVTDPNGKVTQYAYDDAGRLISATDANNGVTQYGYDNENNLISLTDAALNQTTFQYDQYGSVTQVNFPSTYYETYAYDSNGNLLTKTDRNGHAINYGYDFLKRLTSKQYPDSTNVSYTYDNANRLTKVVDPSGSYQFTYDNMSRLTQTSAAYSFISGKTFAVGYGYDAASNRTSMTDPQNKSTAYVYDTLNRLTTLTYPSKNNYGFSYDALGRRTQLTRPNSVTTAYQYDTVSNLLSILHTKSSTTLDGAAYVYDAAGNRTSKTDKRTNVTSTFSYDPLYELTQVLQGSTTTESYSYDAVENRLSSLGVSPYAYSTSNELTSKPGVTYGYDKNGNTLTKVDSTGTTTYNWDFENRLTSVVLPGSGGTVSFKYDPFGRRVQKSSSSGTTNYVYDGANALEEVDGSGNVLARYVQSLAIDQPLAETRGSTTSYYEADGLGSISSLSNSSGALANTYTYDSFGNLIAFSGSVVNPYRYTGREFDSETGSYYYRARYYDPQIGRFISEDPIGFDAGPNFYRYVLNNPVRFTDPLGNDVWLEGPSGNEPTGHLSINVGDPNGNYDSYSFGVNGDPWLGGAVYNDTSHGGEILPDYYLHTTGDEDARVKALLDAQLGNKAPYRPWRTCRNFSQNQFNRIKAMGIGTPSAPPPRTPAPGSKPWTVPSTTSTSAWDWLNLKSILSSSSTSSH